MFTISGLSQSMGKTASVTLYAPWVWVVTEETPSWQVLKIRGITDLHLFLFIPMLDEDNADEFLDPFWNYVKFEAAAEKATEILKKRLTYHASYATTSIKADVSLLRFWEQPRFDWVQRTRVWTSANFTRKFNWKGAKNQELNQEIRYSQKVGRCYQTLP